MKNKNHRKSSGFSLIEMSVSLIVIAVLATGGMSAYHSWKSKRDHEMTQETVADLSTAIVAFRSTQNRYPCPAPLVSRADPAYGFESNCAAAPGAGLTDVASLRDYGTTGPNGAPIAINGVPSAAGTFPTVRIGAIPFRSMNIPEEFAYDSFGNQVIYAVTTDQANAAFDYNPLGGGITVRDQNGTEMTQPAASAQFVVVSVGKDRVGGTTMNGAIPLICNGGGGGGDDDENCDGNDSIFIAAPMSDAAGANNYDDYVKFEAPSDAPMWGRSAADPDDVYALRSGSLGDDYKYNLNNASSDSTIKLWSSANILVEQDPGTGDGGRVGAQFFADSADPSYKFSSALLGSGTTTAGFNVCPAGQVMMGYAENKIKCVPNIDMPCAPGTFLTTISGGKPTCQPICLSCPTPWGSSIGVGTSIATYNGAACAPLVRTCNPATCTLDGDPTYIYTSPPAGCGDCPSPWGGPDIPNGTSITAYSATSCTGLPRQCSNGTLLGDASYNLQNSVAVCGGQCPTPWGDFIDVGVTVQAYKAGDCTPINRTCQPDLTLSGDPSYDQKDSSALNCTPGDCYFFVSGEFFTDTTGGAGTVTGMTDSLNDRSYWGPEYDGSGNYIGDVFHSVPPSSDLILPGDYPSTAGVFRYSDPGTIDMMMIGSGTHVTIWSGPGYTGSVLFDHDGPADGPLFMQNVELRPDYITNFGLAWTDAWLTSPLEAPYDLMFPPASRQWSALGNDMRNWGTSSSGGTVYDWSPFKAVFDSYPMSMGCIGYSDYQLRNDCTSSVEGLFKRDAVTSCVPTDENLDGTNETYYHISNVCMPISSGTETSMRVTCGGGSGCALPWGGSTATGTTVTAYKTGVCPGVSRTCQPDGTLDGDATYTLPVNDPVDVAICSPPPPPADCTRPWGGTVPVGGTIQAYNTTNCAPITRTCVAGAPPTFDGDPSYDRSSPDTSLTCGWTPTCFFQVSGVLMTDSRSKIMAGARTTAIRQTEDALAAECTTSMEWDEGSFMYVPVTACGADYEDIVGVGDYALSTPFARAESYTFDGIAIGADTRVTIYSGPNFTGAVLFDMQGPAVVNNKIWRDNSHKVPSTWITDTWSPPALQAEFPPSSRSWSATDMHAWGPSNNTSVKVQCGAAPPTSCTTPWGDPLANGASVTAWKNTTGVAWGTNFTGCSNTWLSYCASHSTCTTAEHVSAAHCRYVGGAAGTGCDLGVFQRCEASGAPSCASTTLTCAAGTLVGDITYNQAACP